MFVPFTKNDTVHQKAHHCSPDDTSTGGGGGGSVELLYPPPPPFPLAMREYAPSHRNTHLPQTSWTRDTGRRASYSVWSLKHKTALMSPLSRSAANLPPAPVPPPPPPNSPNSLLSLFSGNTGLLCLVTNACYSVITQCVNNVASVFAGVSFSMLGSHTGTCHANRGGRVCLSGHTERKPTHPQRYVQLKHCFTD